MDYRATMDEIGALTRFFTGWSRRDLMGLSVRERRHWIRYAQYVVARQERARDGW